MGYCFNEHETVAEGIKRMACEQLDKAVGQTKLQAKNRSEAIHAARVATKKLRALLRLARSKRTTDFFAKEMCCYRNAGRLLSDVRDATVMIAAFDKLTERYAEQLTPNAFAELRNPFVKTRKQQLSTEKKALAEMARMLKPARPRVAKWPMNDQGFCLLLDGLKRIYKKGRVCMEHVQIEPSVETYHEWRKRVKDLWYQVRLLEPTWPAAVKNFADELERLADYLSDDHDLAILRRRLLKQSPKDRKQMETLVALIDERRAELELEANRLGTRIYVERPKAFVRRFEVFWRTWSAESNVDPLSEQMQMRPKAA